MNGDTLTSLLAPLVVGGIVLAATMAVGWLYQKHAGNAGWVDVFWTFGTGVAGVVVALWPATGATTWRQWLVAALIAVWSARLGLHVAIRVANAPEDPRYVVFRSEWGATFQRDLFWFMQRQAWGSLVLPLAVLLAARVPGSSLRVFDIVGCAIVAVAIAGEALADWQLAAFRRVPANKGKICDAGLWAWSRHPNYFFEWLHWFAYPVIALSLPAYPQGLLAWLAPALMYWVVAHGTGIPPLEAHMLRTRGDDYRRYQARTRALVPIPKTGDARR